MAEGFSNRPAGNQILCKMDLDTDGILHVTVIEKGTGLTKKVHIDNALSKMNAEAIERARDRLDQLLKEERSSFLKPELAGDAAEGAAEGNGSPLFLPGASGLAPEAQEGIPSGRVRAARALIKQCEALFAEMHAEDQEDGKELIRHVETAIEAADADRLDDTTSELSDLIFYVENR